MKIRKQNKLFFYPKGYSRFLLPTKKNFKKKITDFKSKLSDEQLEKVQERVDYYCKTSIQESPENFKIRDLKKTKTPKAYYFDTYKYARFFPENLPINFVFGDVTEVPKLPSVVKSRPISENNQNSILLNLDKARHFVFVEGSKDFLSKENIMIGRGAVFQHHRYLFYEKYFGHPLTDVAQVNTYRGNLDWMKPTISLEKHLEFKFILSLQGNNVATNLKWIQFHRCNAETND